MPLVTISLRRGFADETKQEISERIHRSLVEALGIPDADFNHRILEFDSGHWRVPAGRSERFICVEIRMYPGRTTAQKHGLFRRITAEMALLGMAAEDVFIVIDEPPKENWSVSGFAGS